MAIWRRLNITCAHCLSYSRLLLLPVCSCNVFSLAPFSEIRSILYYFSVREKILHPCRTIGPYSYILLRFKSDITYAKRRYSVIKMRSVYKYVNRVLQWIKYFSKSEKNIPLLTNISPNVFFAISLISLTLNLMFAHVSMLSLSKKSEQISYCQQRDRVQFVLETWRNKLKIVTRYIVFTMRPLLENVYNCKHSWYLSKVVSVIRAEINSLYFSNPRPQRKIFSACTV